MPRLVPLALAMILAACGERAEPTPDAGPDAAAPADAGPDAAAPVDAGPDAAPDAGPEYPRPCADLYDPETVQTFRVEIDPLEWDGLVADCYDYVEAYRPITFRSGDETQAAMIRLKGNWSWSCDKMQFVISFNEVDSGARFHGLRKLVLDAPWYDETLLHERLAMDVLARHGVPYSCVNHARLLVNGAYYGVYANVERIDKEYLQRHFADHDGNLYQGGQELKTNEEIGDTGDRDAYWAAGDLEAVDTVVDLEEAVRVWAGEAMLPDPDSYWAGVEINFYLYHHPARGFLYLPYDADIAFGTVNAPEAVSADPITYQHPGWLREPHYQIVLSDPAWCEAFVAAVADARAVYDVDRMQGQIDAWAAQIARAVEEDPHRTFDLATHESAVAGMRDFVAQRAAFVDDWLAQGGHCPPVWP